MRRVDLMRRSPPTEVRQSFQQYVDWVKFQGSLYPFGSMNGSNPSIPDPSFAARVSQIHERHGVVAAAVTARALLISDLRFAWRNTRASSTPGKLFTDRNLAVLDNPTPMTRTELLFRMEQDVSYSGNAYVARVGSELRRLRPDWVSVVMASEQRPNNLDAHQLPSDARVIGYTYDPGGDGKSAEVFLPNQIIHWKPDPDPLFPWRGSSWVQSVISEISTDRQATEHQSKFFEHAGTPNLVFVMDPHKTPDQVQAFADVMNETHAGAGNAYKNMYLGGGTDVKAVGSSLKDLSLSDIQGGFETRVASRSRVPAVVLGIREGLAGSALNSGNYGQTRRLMADGWFSPTAKGLAQAIQRVLPVPDRAELYPDISEVMFLQEDARDAAEITQAQASTVTLLVRDGFTADSAVEAVTTGDLSALEHTGQTSVQLQTPGNDP